MTSSLRFGTLLVTLLGSAIAPPGAGAEPRLGSATGYAALVLDDGVTRGVSFTAVHHGDGSASGQIEFHDPAPIPDQDVDGTGDPALAESPLGVHVRADVNCLVVDGNSAIVGGQVTDSDVARYVGKQVLLFVEDTAQSRGGFTWGFYEAQDGVSCGTFPWAAYAPVESGGGSLQVR